VTFAASETEPATPLFESGFVIATAGAVLSTIRLIAVDVATLPALSVATTCSW
jgi:hypothetical protein